MALHHRVDHIPLYTMTTILRISSQCVYIIKLKSAHYPLYLTCCSNGYQPNGSNNQPTVALVHKLGVFEGLGYLEESVKGGEAKSPH